VVGYMFISISGLFNNAVSTQTIKRQMVGWSVNNELKRMWKEVAGANSRGRSNRKNCSQDSRLDRNSNATQRR
jgi:hypothetical protein